mmetsp:Transcript_414/g.1095  ORF Transcript_414/g.1095 Transcript_414/m.1095 type:complete len:220 (+) Transcript_414:402-1061(+)
MQSRRSSKMSSSLEYLPTGPTVRDVFYFLEQLKLLSFVLLLLVKVCSLPLPYFSRVRLFFRPLLSSVPTRSLTLLFERVETPFSRCASSTLMKRRQIVHRYVLNSSQCVYSCLDFAYRPIALKRYRVHSRFFHFLLCICCYCRVYYFPRRLPDLNRWLNLLTSAFRALLASSCFRLLLVLLLLLFLLPFASPWRDYTARTFSESQCFLFCPFSRTTLGL